MQFIPHSHDGAHGVAVYRHSFLTSALDGHEWAASGADRFNPEKGLSLRNVWVSVPVWTFRSGDKCLAGPESQAFQPHNMVTMVTELLRLHVTQVTCWLSVQCLSHTHTHTHTRTHTHKNTHTHKHTYKHTHRNTHTQNTHTNTYTQTHTRTNTHTQTHTHTKTHTQTHTRTNTHTQTHTQARAVLVRVPKIFVTAV